jgi:alcohol dehydrogenase YqhD (iron-dependent ADH family)
MHQIGHVLSARHGVTHGASLSIIMPAWMRHLHGKRPGRYVQFAERIFGIDTEGRDDGEVALDAIDRFEAFLADIGVQTRLSDAGITAGDVEAIAEDVVRISFGADGKLAGRPPIDRDDLERILELAL